MRVAGNTLQSAHLALSTTPPEAMAGSLKWYLSPLARLGLPVDEVVLTTLLSLRFMALVFEEVTPRAHLLAPLPAHMTHEGCTMHEGILSPPVLLLLLPAAASALLAAFDLPPASSAPSSPPRFG